VFCGRERCKPLLPSRCIFTTSFFITFFHHPSLTLESNIDTFLFQCDTAACALEFSSGRIVCSRSECEEAVAVNLTDVEENMPAHSSWLNPKLEVRKSSIHGKGVFAKEFVGAGERVAIFGGQIMPIDELNNLPAPLDEYPMQIEERFLIGSRMETQPEDTDYFNHSCDPNCGFKGQLFLVAMRNIEPDEELTFDYAMVLSKSVGSEIEFEMKCRCRSKKCRRNVSENDWKKPRLQHKYLGYFSQYLEDRLAEQNFMDLHEGDLERSLNKFIDTLIVATESYIVYLDDEYFVEWSTNDNYEGFSQSFGEISNAVAHLETLSITLLSKRQRKPFRRLLGEGIARSLENDEKVARNVIRLAEKYLKARSTERARMWSLASHRSLFCGRGKRADRARFDSAG
jgi:hypothetical protein